MRNKNSKSAKSWRKGKSCERVGHLDEHHICMRTGFIFVFFLIKVGMKMLQRGWTRMLKSFQWLLTWLLKLLQLLLCPGFSQSVFFTPKWNPGIISQLIFLCARASSACQCGSLKVWLGWQEGESCWPLDPELPRM